MKNDKIHYKSSKDILKYHGIFVLIFYWVFRCIRIFLYTRLWNKISHIKIFHARDMTYNKSTAWWQDTGVIIHIIITGLIIYWGFFSPIVSLISWVAIYFIIDMLCFHINVLWFDDLGIGYKEYERMVWSHRRLLFQAIVNYAETILLFTVIYRAYVNKLFSKIFQQSFSIATTLSFNQSDFSVPIWIVNSQILVSIFYLVVVISVISSIGYSRPEIGKSFDN